jgi:uncharacterized protein (TIGR02147 family)
VATSEDLNPPGNVFSAPDYRAYVRADIDTHAGERGYQKRLADAAGCKPSYLSQVLHSHIHLTLDQAASLCTFWSFNEDRTEFFLALVQQERAASKSLKSFLDRKIKSLRDRHSRVSTRVTAGERVSARDDRAAYYTSWHMPAIHVLTSISAFQTAETLAGRLQISKAQVLSRLDDLMRMGFVAVEGDRYRSIVSDIHVEHGSPLNLSNHFQWRHRALTRIVDGDPRNLHYTAVHALSVADVEVLREMMMEFIQRSRAVVAPSVEEDAVGVCCDLFYL